MSLIIINNLLLKCLPLREPQFYVYEVEMILSALRAIYHNMIYIVKR